MMMMMLLMMMLIMMRVESDFCFLIHRIYKTYDHALLFSENHMATLLMLQGIPKGECFGSLSDAK